jgi:hypothetical protein
MDHFEKVKRKLCFQILSYEVNFKMSISESPYHEGWLEKWEQDKVFTNQSVKKTWKLFI